MAFGKSFQPMNFAWEIARKIDRLDIDEYTTRGRMNRLVVLYGLVRAINPKEKPDDEEELRREEGGKFRAIPDIIQEMAARRRRLRHPEIKMKMDDDDLSRTDNDIENDLDGFWDDLAEVIYRCRIIENVRAPEESAP